MLHTVSRLLQVRAKYMALEPSKNRYVKYMRSIRAIQDYLVGRAARHAVPSVNNTNVDRSVATIHATTLGCLRRQARVRLSPALGLLGVLEDTARCSTPSTKDADVDPSVATIIHATALAPEAEPPPAPGQSEHATPWACFGVYSATHGRRCTPQHFFHHLTPAWLALWPLYILWHSAASCGGK